MLPKFSLITSTINRTAQLENFLEHLARQTYSNFELIIVDQNDDDRLLPIINEYKYKFCIIHIHSEKGVSHGRNRGADKISGELAAFPDDDCWYEDDLLEKVVKLFAEHPDIDVISGRTIDAKGQTSLGRFDNKSGEITKKNILKRGNSNTLFMRREVTKRNAFDESLGVGATTKWGSGEETDYLLQAIAEGFKLYYYRNLTVYHNNPIIDYNNEAIKRGYLYGCGMGRVFKKHHYPVSFVFIDLVFRLGAVVVSLVLMDIQRVKYHWAVFKGRLEGWTSTFD